MRKWVLTAALAGVGYYLLDQGAVVPGVLGLAAAAAIAYFSLRAPKPQVLPAPVEHRNARYQARQIERQADRAAERMVNRAIKKADRQGREALDAANRHVAAEAEQKWVN